MLSSRLYAILSTSFKFGQYFGNSCIQYNKSTQLFFNRPSLYPTTRLMFFILVTYCVLKSYAAYLLQIEGKIDESNLTLAIAIGTGMCLVLQGIPTWYSPEYCIAVNGLLTFYGYLHQKWIPHWSPNKSKINWIINLLLLGFTGAMISLTVIICLFVTLFPRGPSSLGVFISDKYFSLPLAILVVLLHWYCIVAFLGGLVHGGSFIFSYLVYVSLFLHKELRLGRVKYLTNDGLRNSQNLRHCYRSFQVLHKNAMDCLAIFLVLSNAAFMLHSIFGSFVLMRYWLRLNVTSEALISMNTSFTIIAWSFLLQMGKMFFSRGGKVLTSWRLGNWKNDKHESKIMKRFAKSCKPILLSYGIQFVVGKVSLLVYFRGIVKGTMRALLTTR